MIRKLDFKKYQEKVLGAWIGKSLGGIIGAPFESHKIKGNSTEENCWPSKIYPNDDLDIQVVWMELMEEQGIDLTQLQLQNFWRERCWYNFAEYGNFLYNAQRGINAPLSGEFNNNFYRECMGCPIRSEIWSIVWAGNCEDASKYAKIDGSLDHVRHSVEAEMFWAAAGAEAFFVDNIYDCIEAGKKALLKDSFLLEIAETVEKLYEEFNDWSKIWLKLVRLYGHRDNSKVEINFAFTLLSLYEGKGKLNKTIVTAINCGWDADCTAATAGALVGIINGINNLPQVWMEKMGEFLTCDVNVRHKKSSLQQFADDTALLGLEASLTLNNKIEFTDVPSKDIKKVKEKILLREKKSEITFDIEYLGMPVVYSNKASKAKLKIYNYGAAKSGILSFESENLYITPLKVDLLIGDNSYREIEIEIKNAVSNCIWDKNLIIATFNQNIGLERDKVFNDYKYVFGFSGARQWKVYGPYWDAWDTRVSEICPYRNDKIITHPVNVVGCHTSMVHNFSRLDKEYLCENELLKNDIKKEDFVLVQREEDFIDNSQVDGFIGESCYYYVRDIVFKQPTKCIVSFGMTVPCKIFINGVLKHEQEFECSWGTRDFETVEDINNTIRIVIKIAKNTDLSRMSLQFIKIDVAGDKMKGESYLIDSFGDKI